MNSPILTDNQAGWALIVTVLLLIASCYGGYVDHQTIDKISAQNAELTKAISGANGIASQLEKISGDIKQVSGEIKQITGDIKQVSGAVTKVAAVPKAEPVSVTINVPDGSGVAQAGTDPTVTPTQNGGGPTATQP